MSENVETSEAGKWVVAGVVFVIFGAVLIYRSSGVSDETKARLATAQARLEVANARLHQIANLKAEDIIRLSPSATACLTEDALLLAGTYAAAGEKTKFIALVEKGACIEPRHDLEYKVLHVGNRVIEITPIKLKSAVGVWVTTDAIEAE